MALAEQPTRGKMLAKVIKSVKIVSVPSVSETTPLASLREGLPAELRIKIPKKYNKIMLAYLDDERKGFASYISSKVSEKSPYLDVKAIRYRDGSFIMTVVLGADKWIRSFIDTDYKASAQVGESQELEDALEQLNNDLRKAVEAIRENFKGFFQTDKTP